MMALNAVELTVLVVWAVGIAAALYVAGDRHVTGVQRFGVLVLAIVVPVVGTFVAIWFAVARIRRGHPDGASTKPV